MSVFGRIALIVSFPVYLLACQQDANAHARSESYSTWQVSGGEVTGIITVAAAEVMSLVAAGDAQPLDQLLADHVVSTVAIESAAGACPSPGTSTLRAARGFVRIEIVFDCDDEAPESIRYAALFDRLPAHVHYARFSSDAGPLAEILFTERLNEAAIDVSARAPSFGAFLDLGIRHILSGIDHIAFLLGMLLVAGTLMRGITAVTGFTLGHSLSLAAAVLGFVEADGRLVEAFIGFTVALLAVEFFLLRRPSAAALALAALLCAWAVGALSVAMQLVPARAAIAYLGFGIFAFCYLSASSRLPDQHDGPLAAATLFIATTCFGMIHGFGFAGFLMETGILGNKLLAPLLGFNLGVEIGQLALLLLAFVAFRLFRGHGLNRLAPIAAAGLCGIGVFWFVSRSLVA